MQKRLKTETINMLKYLIQIFFRTSYQSHCDCSINAILQQFIFWWISYQAEGKINPICKQH